MALRDRIDNAKRALADSKIRMIVVILAVIAIVILAVAIIKFKRSQLPATGLESSITRAPEISSIPGVGQPTREYAKLQEQQNLELAEEAARKGTSAIPTVVRTTYLDVGVSPDLSEKAGATSAAGCDIQDLKRARLAGVTASELRCRGCSVSALKTAGLNAGELKDTGFNADSLRTAGFNEEEINMAGFGTGDCSIKKVQEARGKGVSVADLKKLGCSAGELRDGGFSAKDLKDAGFSAEDLKKAGFDAASLKDAGFTSDELKAAGFTDGDLIRAGIILEKAPTPEVSAIPLRAKGYSENEIKATLTPTVPDVAGRLSKEKLANMTTQELEDFMSQQQSLMRQQANELFANWSQISTQQYVAGEVPTPQSAGGSMSAPGTAATNLQAVDVYKAGTILFATLDSEVNSDENTPVMATVVQGPLKDSKLLGNLQRVDKKVLLQFSVLSVPKLTNSISVNAVAIDPNTAKTALASKVDNHYMLRYGTMLATSFVGGLSEAIQGSGGQTQITSLGTTTNFPEIGFTKQLIVALGKMGKQVGTAMSPNINMPPTVKVNSGSSIGLLLIADLSVPKA